MFTIDEMLSKKNQKLALLHFKGKGGEGRGINQVRLSELENYWDLNKERIIKEIKEERYEPGPVKIMEVYNKSPKKREIACLNVIDRFITRLLSQKLYRYIEPEFLPHSFAYQLNKGIVEAVDCAKTYLDNDCKFVVEIDIKSFFDTIPLDRMIKLLKDRIEDNAVIHLIEKYLYCRVFNGEKSFKKNVGLIQGNSISPVLSNLYLHYLDCMLEAKGYNWLRYADNICVYTKTKETAQEIFGEIVKHINSLGLNINTNKSGIYDPFTRRLLGYDLFKRKDGTIEVRRHIYQETNIYNRWHESVLWQANKEYHIVRDGILNKKDYSLLFENEDNKYHIPVGVTEQLNLYSDITVAAAARNELNANKIRLVFMNKFGMVTGFYVPASSGVYGVTTLKQCKLYLDEKARLEASKKLEIAGFYNMRSNLKYYKKHGKELDDVIKEITKAIDEASHATSITFLMLLEARVRQYYYRSFSSILENPDFIFERRSKQPPKDAINALISFGNTLLYNFFLQVIGRIGLDPKIGVIHATTNRATSLNLDFADLFKPVVTDRVIFSVINRRQLNRSMDFEINPKNNGIYMNDKGKRTFIEAFEKKLLDRIQLDGNSITYAQLMEREVRHFASFIRNDTKYTPYKYY